ncbi:protease pro-enzyme activation domain-containing protein [Leifsonia xyli]|uniref:protease pro-enzyme activation domain-containing protein n=1 Tax=Leifsonia xyli TaxID=1575 RepID=UPI00351CB669
MPGAAPADQTLEGEISFPLRDQKGAEELAKQVSTPGLPGYRKPLTPTQWIQRFSAPQAVVGHGGRLSEGFGAHHNRGSGEP